MSKKNYELGTTYVGRKVENRSGVSNLSHTFGQGSRVAFASLRAATEPTKVTTTVIEVDAMIGVN